MQDQVCIAAKPSTELCRMTNKHSMSTYLNNAATVGNDVWGVRVNGTLQSHLLLQQMLHSVQHMIQHSGYPHL